MTLTVEACCGFCQHTQTVHCLTNGGCSICPCSEFRKENYGEMFDRISPQVKKKHDATAIQLLREALEIAPKPNRDALMLMWYQKAEQHLETITKEVRE